MGFLKKAHGQWEIDTSNFLRVGGVTPRKRRFFETGGWVAGPLLEDFCSGWLRGLRSLANAG